MRLTQLTSLIVGALCAALTLGCEQKKSHQPPAPTAAVSKRIAAPRPLERAPEFEPAVVPVPDVDATCARVAATPIPNGDLPTEAERASLTGCDSETLYYGIGAPADFTRARHCAYLENLRPEPKPPQQKHSVIGGPAILMMIYANGLGVGRNVDLSLRFACEFGGSGFEVEARIAQLLLRAAPYALSEPRMDVCDNITSGYMAGFCAGHDERIARVARQARMRVATAGFPPKELEALQRAAASYVDTKSNFEVDLSGSARAAFAIEAKQRLSDEVLSMLEQLHDPAFVPPSQSLTSLEAELISTQAHALRCREHPLLNSVSAAGVQKTQAAWVRYRDAFNELAHKVRPEVPPEKWSSWLIQQRLIQLQELAAYC
ncbi:MAG: hypothetical protein QM756_36370 [Polyangiaceae bacterium]